MSAATEFWEKLNIVTSTKPMPRAQTTAFIFSQFTTRGAIHYMGLPEQDYFGSQPEVGRHPIATVPTSTLPERKKFDAVQSSAGDDIYEEIEEFPKKLNGAANKVPDHQSVFKFNAGNNCLADDDDDDDVDDDRAESGGLLTSNRREKIYEQIPREIFRDLRRPQHFRRLGSEDTEAASANSRAIMLKDLVRAATEFFPGPGQT